MTSPFHVGEQTVQERLGVRDEIEPWARKVVRSQLPEEHRAFYAQLPYVVVAARDDAGRPWATLLAAKPGFLESPDPQSLRIDALPGPGDALAHALAPGADLGLLGIELHTRRRNRANGRVAARMSGGLEVGIEQAFGNCPQFISDRRWRPAEPMAAGVVRSGSKLDARQQRLVAGADTFFIATGFRGEGESPTYGMDASHRGGPAGFVEADDGQHLVFPDYAGNNHFNTLGNLALDDRVGLLFVDFERGDLLQITGKASIEWSPDQEARAGGAMRRVHVQVDRVVEQPGALPIRFAAPGEEAQRELELVERTRETDEVTSFVFADPSGRGLPEHRAGQYLPIELAVPGLSQPVARTYSLSGIPDGRHYRITVKREPQGLVSRHLHDHLQVGDRLVAREPQGDFVLPSRIERPVVLISAGVGITPMLPMLHELAQLPEVTGWLVHGTPDSESFALREELERIVEMAPDLRLHTAYSRKGPEARAEVGGAGSSEAAQEASAIEGWSLGRIDAALLERLVPGLDAEFWLCGPVPFLSDLSAGLAASGVPAERIRYETFGPAATA